MARLRRVCKGERGFLKGSERPEAGQPRRIRVWGLRFTSTAPRPVGVDCLRKHPGDWASYGNLGLIGFRVKLTCPQPNLT